MKKIIVTVLLAGCSTPLLGQGLVNFFNNATTLISASDMTAPVPVGTYYFGLLIAPAGTTDRTAFTFTGVYGTNQATAGRFTGGPNVVVPNWPAGQTRAFMVAGWSADAGHDWNPAWLRCFPGRQLGFSAVAEGIAGGFDGTATIPTLNVFGLSTISSGFEIQWLYIGPSFVGLNIQPGQLTVPRGGTGAFSYNFYACPPPTSCQWYLNGVPIPGANASRYEISNAQPEHAGNYYAILTGSWGVFGDIHQSPVATLTVLLPPAITAQPQARTAELGSETRFSVGASGDPPPTYRWFFNGNADLTGVTTISSLQLTNLQFSQSGAYAVVVSNLAGAVTSTPAMLNVIPVVPRRLVPGLLLAAEPATLVNIDHTPQLDPPDWQSFPTVYFSNSPQFYFDLSSPLPAQRFYRVWQAGAPSVVPSVSLPGVLPALTLTGAIGSRVEVEGINQIGPTDAWFSLDTVTLTETPQLYFDTSAIGQPPRLYRLSPVP